MRIYNVGIKLRQAGPVFTLGLLLLTTLSLAAQEKKGSGTDGSAKDEGSIGFIASKSASPKEVGLPVYPGARPHKDEKEDSPSVLLGLWGRSSGFKLAVMKMESEDAPEKVAAFYNKALAKYGRVLSCSGSSKTTNDKDTNKSSHALDCDSDQPEKGELVLKAGTKERQHIVAIRPNAAGSLFQLVYVESRGSDSN